MSLPWQNKVVQSSDMLQLWFSKIGDTAEIERSTENLLSDTEQNRLSSTRSNDKRREFLLSRALMRHALSQHFLRPIDGWSFTERVNQPPKINNLPDDFYTSLSHSKGLICFAISSSPVGIDLEYSDTSRDFIRLAKAFMNDEEYQLLIQSTDDRAELFYRTWCSKEAYYKALPAFQQGSLNFKDIKTSLLLDKKSNWHSIDGKIEDYFLSVIIKNSPGNISLNQLPQKDTTYDIQLKVLNNFNKACYIANNLIN